MYIHRLVTNRLLKLLQNFPCIVVSGARQVGKSTLLQHVFSTMDYVTFDPSIDIENARKDPDLFLNTHKTPLILDEIQYAPEVVASIKRRIDKDRKPGQYILTGSQQWQVLKNISESLAGRVAFLDLDSFSLAETSNQSSDISVESGWLWDWLNQYSTFPQLNNPSVSHTSVFDCVWRGGFPAVQTMDIDIISDFFMAYQRTYIERDVRVIGDVQDWHQLGRFMQLISALSSQEVNVSQLGRDIGMTPQTAQRWLMLLRSTFQWMEIPAFSNNLLKRVSKKPKGYIKDTGFGCFLSSIPSPKALAGHPLWGSFFETYIVNEIQKRLNTFSIKPKRYHWRSAGGAEVDHILELNGVLYPIEIKGTSLPSRSDTSGITAFRKAHPQLNIAKGIVIATCEKPFPLSENDYAIPWNFL